MIISTVAVENFHRCKAVKKKITFFFIFFSCFGRRISGIFLIFFLVLAGSGTSTGKIGPAQEKIAAQQAPQRISGGATGAAKQKMAAPQAP